MSTETRYYDNGDGWEHKIIIHHGASESYVIYDSEHGGWDCWNYEEKTKNFHDIVVGNPKKESWLPEVLKRAKDIGDL
jgi:hypothetical protein